MSTTLRYSSELANPTAYIEVDTKFTSVTRPSRIRIRVWNGTSYFTLSNAASQGFWRGDTTAIRLAAQYTSPDTATGVYSRTVYVTAFWGDSTAPTDSLTKTISDVRVLVQNEKNSPYGRGWTVTGDARIHVQPDSGLLLTDGAGGLAYFARISCSGSPLTCTYTSPKGDYTTLVRTVVSGANVYTRTGRAGDVTVWTASGLLKSTTDRWGNAFEIERMSTGVTSRIYRTKMTTLVGSTTISKYTTFAYSDSGKLASVTLPDGRQSTFTVGMGVGGLLTAVTDPDGRPALNLTYTSGAIVALAGRDTATTSIIYDNYGQVAKLISPSMVIDSGTTVRDTTLVWSQKRVLLEYQSQEVYAVAAPADLQDSTFLRITNARGTTITTWSHLSGQVARTIVRSASGSSNQHSTKYDTEYRADSVFSPDGVVAYTWDGPRLLRTGRDQPNLVLYDSTTYTYTDYDQLETVRTNGTLRTRYFFSGSKLAPDSVSADSSVVTRFTYDARGRGLTVTDRGTNRVVTTAYETTHANPSSVVRTATSVTTATTSYTYDGSGRVVSVTDPASRVFATTYDSLNRVIRTIGPIADTVRYLTRDSTHTDTLFDAKGQRYVTVRNARGLVTRSEDPRGKSDYYWYDRLGRLVKTQNRRGDSTRVEYNGFDQVTRRRAWTAGGQLDTARYNYDTQYGLWVAGGNAESIDSTYRLPEGRPYFVGTIRGSRAFQVTYGYLDSTWTWARFVSGSGSPTWIDTSHTKKTVYHRTAAIVDFAGKEASIGADAYGRHYGKTLPTNNTPANKVKEVFTYSWDDRPLTVTYTGLNIGTSQNRTYSYYDVLGRIGRAQTSAAGNPFRAHEYDTGGRLTKYVDYRDSLLLVGYDSVWNELHYDWDLVPAYETYGMPKDSALYTYDKLANRTDHSASLDSANRLLAFDGWTITYDDAGYMTKRKKGADSLVYTWNALGQLIQVTAPGYTTKYGYDAFGNRVRKVVNSDTTRYVLEDGQVIIELDNTWQPTKYTYYPGTDRPSSMVRAGKRYYFLQDAQGNVVAVLDSVGTIKNTYTYTPYGEAIATTTAVSNPFRYKGRDWDAEARLYFMRARYYDPQLARFISDDPIGLSGGSNPTAFVGGEPVGNSDPTGAFCQVIGWDWKEDENMRVYTPRYGGTTCDDHGSGGSPFARPGSFTGARPFGSVDAMVGIAEMGLAQAQKSCDAVFFNADIRMGLVSAWMKSVEYGGKEVGYWFVPNGSGGYDRWQQMTGYYSYIYWQKYPVPGVPGSILGHTHPNIGNEGLSPGDLGIATANSSFDVRVAAISTSYLSISVMQGSSAVNSSCARPKDY